jgi:hypothetical protein
MMGLQFFMHCVFMEHPQETMVFTTGCPALWETASASWLQKLLLLDVPKLIA